MSIPDYYTELNTLKPLPRWASPQREEDALTALSKAFISPLSPIPSLKEMFEGRVKVARWAQQEGVSSEVSEDFLLTIQGKRYSLAVVRSAPTQVANKADYHYYLRLSNGQEEWIIDPSWKQFVVPRRDLPWRGSAQSCKDFFFSSRFPAVLAMKKEDWTTLMQLLGQEAQDPSIAACGRYWNNPAATPLDVTWDRDRANEEECVIM